ncbi:energy-coupling factor transporter transmembrane component T family protein [Atopococcus tabaci]|uniref:energy-coupling factor transporter transmembrane component T family protein n=1 Tax=Atopococcus tabaci TaxID=269774 RepID=UPI002409DCE2|nr:energy-coupling factor transporter transmembrane component T [Atopococcus tabaci]
MGAMTLYVKQRSPVHSMDPLTKILYVIVSIAVTYILRELWTIAAMTAVTFLLLVIGKVFRKIIPVLGLSLLLIVSIIVVQGFFNPENETVLFELGFLTFYEEGMRAAALFTLRILNMIGSFGVLILTTKPDDLVESLIKRGFSPRFGYILLSVLQLIPQMSATMGKITDAQRSRGMETDGNLWVRTKAFFPLIVPVVLNSLNETRERAIALEVRGFSSKGKRTFLNVTEDYPYRHVIRGVLLAVLIGAIVWRVWT